MKIGDKVFIAVEVEEIEKSSGMFTGTTSDLRTYWYKENQAITQLPIQEGRWMMVSDDENNWKKRFVVGKFRDIFITFSDADNEERLKIFCSDVTPWKYAKEIPTKRTITLAEVAKLTGENIDEIEFEKL